jgi:hypothetical protein
MFDSFVGVLGIVLSLVLFFIGYRQTVGAKKERIAACNTDVEKILVRRIVLESYTPTRVDVGRLIEGKARDFRVREDDLLSEAQVLNSVYTRVVESDLIPSEQRNEIIGRIVPSLVEAEVRPIDESEAPHLNRRMRVISQTSTAMAVLALLASTAGAVVAALPELANLDTRYPTVLQTAALAGAASLILITAWLFVNRLRSSQEELPTRGTEAEDYIRFEREVEVAVRRLGLSVRTAPAGSPGDFLAEHGSNRFLIEVTAWPRHVPARILSEMVRRLSDAGRELKADVIVVTRTPILDIPESIEKSGVRFCTVRQLREFIPSRLNSNPAA